MQRDALAVIAEGSKPDIHTKIQGTASILRPVQGVNRPRGLRLCAGDRSLSHPRFDTLIRACREWRLRDKADQSQIR